MEGLLSSDTEIGILHEDGFLLTRGSGFPAAILF
jgi:hypothetical protein